MISREQMELTAVIERTFELLNKMLEIDALHLTEVEKTDLKLKEIEKHG